MRTNGRHKPQAHASHWMEKAWPEARRDYVALRDKVFGPGALDERTKAFIQLACVSLLRCRHCVDNSLSKLKGEHKASDREIAEAMMVASMAASGTNMAWAREVFEEHLG